MSLGEALCVSERRSYRRYARRTFTRMGLCLATATVLAGCQSGLGLSWRGPDPAASRPVAIDFEMYHRADQERADRLEREVELLRADLRAAQEALIAAESGLRGKHSRASAVSSLAAARIEVERASRAAPWSSQPVGEARAMIDDADHQLQQGNFGSALFFVHRARRIASRLEAEAAEVKNSPDSFFVRSRRVNLRAGPSTRAKVLHVLLRGTPVFHVSDSDEWSLVRTAAGAVGWIHRSLVTKAPGRSGPGPT